MATAAWNRHAVDTTPALRLPSAGGAQSREPGQNRQSPSNAVWTQQMNDQPGTEWVTIAEAAHLLSVSRRTIYNWLQDGKITAVRTPGGSLRVARAALFTPDTKYAAPEI